MFYLILRKKHCPFVNCVFVQHKKTCLWTEYRKRFTISTMFKNGSVLSFWSWNKKQTNQSMIHLQNLHIPSNCYIKQNAIKQSIKYQLPSKLGQPLRLLVYKNKKKCPQRSKQNWKKFVYLYFEKWLSIERWKNCEAICYWWNIGLKINKQAKTIVHNLLVQYLPTYVSINCMIAHHEKKGH